MPHISLVFPHSSFLINERVFPPLGILYLSSSLKKEGYTTEVIDLGLGMSKEVHSPIVGVSFTTPQKEEAFDLMKYYRSQNRFVIAGGPHPTHMPYECFAKSSPDVIIQGEADKTLPEFLDDPEEVTFPIIKRTPEEKNLDSLPMPDWEALPLKDYHYEIDGKPATTIITSRGCPAKVKCSFCSRITETFRMHSANRIFNEIMSLRELYSFDAFMIFDDVFIGSIKRLIGLCSLIDYAGLNFTFRCFGRANLLTKDVCLILKKLGVAEVGIGVESGSDSVLTMNMKGTSKEKNTWAIENLREAGIRAKAFLIVGLPGETEETIKETEEWIKEAKPFDVDISIFQPLPGSPIFANPNRFGISFEYGTDCWFKGIPGKYHTSTKGKLTPEQLINFRDELESKYKRKDLLR